MVSAANIEKSRSVKNISVTLFQIFQTGLLSFQDGAHAPQRGSLQLFTPVQRISILHQTHVVLGNTGEGKIFIKTVTRFH